jgi:hypothetical protein
MTMQCLSYLRGPVRPWTWTWHCAWHCEKYAVEANKMRISVLVLLGNTIRVTTRVKPLVVFVAKLPDIY